MSKTTNAALGLIAAGALLLPAGQAGAGSPASDGRFEMAQAQPQPDPKQKAEAERRAKAEAARQQAERAKQQAEQARQQAAERARQQAEQARQQADRARQQQEAERRARQEQQRREVEQRQKEDAARRAKADQDRQRAQAERDKAQADRRREDDARRAKAEQDRERERAERDKAQADRRKEEDARRAKAEQDRERERAERDKAQADRRKEDDARRAKAEQDRQKAEAEQRQKEDAARRAKGADQDRQKQDAERRKDDDARRAKADQDRQKSTDDRKKGDDSRAAARPATGPDADKAGAASGAKDAARSGESGRGDGSRRDGASGAGQAAGGSGRERAAGSPPTSNFVGKGVAIRDNLKLQDVKSQRQVQREEGGSRVVIREPGGRQIVRESNRAVIVNSDVNRFRWNARDFKQSSGAGGTRVTTVVRPNGTTIITTEDSYGRVLRRSRRDDRGREHVFYQNRSRPSGWTLAAVAVAVAVPTILIARHLYEVDAREARYDDYYSAFRAEPVQRLDRVYTLDEVRYNYPLRAHMRSVDINTISFQSGSWDIDPSQFRKLDDIARAIDDVLRDNPDEVFLIEGHTDAVGDTEDNLTLSDRRAESVARVLTEEFGIPPENLTTQGYGEEFLKVQTEGPEPRNRRVVIRRITPLVSENYRR